MKLLRVKILGENFRSLPANADYEFNDTGYENKLSTKVFAGLNGSGKSNFLELLAEIFYYLERSQLANTPKAYIENKNFGFEIEYILPKSKSNFHLVEIKRNGDDVLNLDKVFENDVHIQITKKLDGILEMSYALYGEKNFSVIRKNFTHFLPSKIIAYTSGQNELLSNPFIRLRYHYFEQMTLSETNFCNHRLYFLNQESNYSIFVANMLLGAKIPLDYIKKIFTIEDVYSFRITLNYKHYTKEAEKILAKKVALMEPLIACATTWKNDKNSNCLILDFIVDEATHEAFRYHYDNSAFKLFQTFYELQSLNLLIEKQQTRKFVVNAYKTFNISDELSKPDPSGLIFRIEKIRIKKKNNDKSKTDLIYYKSLSDGEHQLNEVIGSVMMMEEDTCLFLMDEPDTHFNPKWRAKMVTMLNKVSGRGYDKDENPENIRKHEIIITTHSPFIISDNYKEDVYKFVRNEEELKINSPKHETYGTSITFLMKQIFERDVTISDYANKELQKFKKDLKNISDENLKNKMIDAIEERLIDFGESVEKFDMYNYLSNIKKK
jgi:restriction system-associated AAA family ATPase